MSMLPTNEIVARITGMNRKLLTDSREAGGGSTEPDLGGTSCPSPLDDIRRRGPQPHEVRQKAYEESRSHTRGDRATFAYDKATDSQKVKAPKHRMPKQDVDDEMYGAPDLDDEPQQVGSKTTEAKGSMSKFYKEYIGSMEEFRHFAGLPLVEDAVKEPRAGHSGDVPTSGVGKQNKMKGGLPGLEGQALQDIEPKTGNEENVGDAKEMTLDQALAMLKKEGIDTDDLWAEFLEPRGLSPEVFSQLVDEAMEGEDQDEIDQILAVEDMFLQQLPQMLPEGFRDLFGLKKKQPAGDPLAPAKAAAAAIQKHGAAGVRAANAHGVSADKVVPLTKKKPAMVSTHPKHVETELGMATSVASTKPSGYRQDFSQGTRRSRSLSPTRQMVRGEQWEMECDDDGAGNPRMPWESKLAPLARKYELTESKRSMKMAKPKMAKPMKKSAKKAK